MTRTSLETIYGRKGPPLDDSIADLFPERTPVNELALPKHRVVCHKDHGLEYPELFLDVFIAGDHYEEAAFVPMFARARCRRAKTPEEADLVVFTGGSDVNPALYGEECHPKTRWDDKRDTDDISLYLVCLEAGIPMFGVCRGAQFLSVMNGGKLIQDINNHQGGHSMLDIRTNRRIDKISSVHHQAVIPNKDMRVLGTSHMSTTRYLNATDYQSGPSADIEAFFYKDTCCIGVQGHPEYSGYNYFTKWCLELINDFVVLNNDVIWEKIDDKAPTRRLDKTVIEKRERRDKIKRRVKPTLTIVS